LFSQNCEQQSPFFVQAFPSVEHVLLSGVHLPFVPHVPLQHSLFVVHASLSLVHVGGWHAPRKQLLEQQSLDTLQALPRFVHVPPSPQLIKHPPPSELGASVTGASPMVPSGFPPSPLPLLSPPHATAMALLDASTARARRIRFIMRRRGANALPSVAPAISRGKWSLE
jgi:hypothetical protein